MNKFTFYDVLTKAKKRDSIYNYLHKQFSRLPKFGWVFRVQSVFSIEIPDGSAKLEISKGCYEGSVRIRYVAPKNKSMILVHSQKQYETALADVEIKMMSALSNYLKDKKLPLTEGEIYER